MVDRIVYDLLSFVENGVAPVFQRCQRMYVIQMNLLPSLKMVSLFWNIILLLWHCQVFL